MSVPTRMPTRLAVATLAVAACLLAGCSDDAPAGGEDSPRAVIDAHLRFAGERRLVEDCELRSPAVIEAMASIDRTDADGYCAFAVGDQPDVSDEVAAESKRLYTDMEVEQIEEADGLASFRLTSADGTYTEWIETVEVDGRWYISEATDDGGGHDHDHGEEGHDHEDHDAEGHDGGTAEP